MGQGRSSKHQGVKGTRRELAKPLELVGRVPSKKWKCTQPAFRKGSVVPVGGIVGLRDFALVPLNLEFVLESPRLYRRFCELLLPGLSCYYSDCRRGQLNFGGCRDGLLRRKDPPGPSGRQGHPSGCSETFEASSFDDRENRGKALCQLPGKVALIRVMVSSTCTILRCCTPTLRHCWTV